MVSRTRRSSYLWSIVLLSIGGACSGNGCGGCSLESLPPGGVPLDQTIEGGAQVRITPAGFNKIKSIIPGVINDSLGDGFCLPKGSVDLAIVDFRYCDANPPGACTNDTCAVSVSVDDLDIFVPTGSDFLRVHPVIDASVPIDITTFVCLPFVGCNDVSSCTLTATLEDGQLNADIRFGIDSGNGELTVALDDVSGVNITGIDFDGCGVLDSVLNAVIGFLANVLDSAFGDFVVGALTPALDDLVQGLLPDPLGIEGVADLGAVFGGISPGTSARLEARIVPGGYVHLERNGLSLGIITATNSDRNPATRSSALDSEPALCVPPLAAPDFAAPPASLRRSARGAFKLDGATAFRGQPDPADDVVIGASETFLDLAGHHAVTSGAMCLGIGTSLVEQLNLGTIGILVPSLAQLGSGDGDEPLLLVTRPQKAVDFSIGSGSEADPSLTIHIRQLEVDFYAFLFERYTRGFTMSLDLDVGINLEFTTDSAGNPAILPMLVGLDSEMIGIEVLNAEFLREDEATLESVLPTVFDLALPLVSGGLEPIALPELAGFRLTNLSVAKVTTTEDDFLAITARLGGSPALAALAQRYPSVAPAFDELADATPRPPALGKATLARVTTPEPARVIAGLAGRTGGALPTVEIDAAATDDIGRPLEWMWNIDGGMWRPFTQARPLVIRDRAFAFQGKYDIQLRSRVVGDYTTLDPEPTIIPVTIDSVGPRIHTDRIARDGDDVVATARDIVSRDAVELAFGEPGADRPSTPWGDGRIAVAELALVARGGLAEVWARDETGNESSATVDLGELIGFHGTGQGGCECSTGGARGGLGMLLLAAGVLAVIGRRRRGGNTVAMVLLAAGVATAPACSCSSDAMSCETDGDCASFCDPGTVPLCFENQCLCADDVPLGRIGQYSEMALASDGTVYVSAYNSRHGDLMVAAASSAGRIPDEAWEFVDGVPDGPVVVEDSDIRGGIFEPGENVGLYTDIALAPDGSPMVSYFDADRASLKFAHQVGGSWQIHDVELGTPQGSDDSAPNYAIYGQYTALTLRQGDGHPGIAYFAQIQDDAGLRTEVKFAQANVPAPGAPGDWTITVVDSAEVPGDAEADPLTIPPGLGLFVNATRFSDGRAVVVYYDRLEGQLQMVTETAGGGFGAPTVLDGGAGNDVGWYPAVVVDGNDTVHVSYVNASHDDLTYFDTSVGSPELVDDGYRVVGETDDGLPKPEFHFVGDDSSVLITGAGPIVTYQDATVHELLYSRQVSPGMWERQTIAGDEDPFTGGYGFYASSAFDGTDLVTSTWVVDQSADDAWVEIFRQTIVVE